LNPEAKGLPMNTAVHWDIINPEGKFRVVVTKQLPGERWLQILTGAGCRVAMDTGENRLDAAAIEAAFGRRCDAAIGQLTEAWDSRLLRAFKKAGGRVYSNYAVGFNNVDITTATAYGIPVGNTPGVLTEATAEMAVALTFAAARRLGEAERYLRAGRFRGWLPSLFTGRRIGGKTLGIIGAGRIGEAYARMMVEGCKMNLLYYDIHPNRRLSETIARYAAYLKARGLPPVTCRRTATVEELLQQADVVSLHTVLDDNTHHLINAERLGLMKKNAVLINTSRGPVIDETALVHHLQTHPDFRAGLDVFENEPRLAPGLEMRGNAVLLPHIASATRWTREGMAVLAACNVAALISGYPVWNAADVSPFLTDDPPPAAPSIVNARDLQLPVYGTGDRSS